MVAALAAARELPQLSLDDALELTILIARKDPRRHPRVAARWLQRYLEKDPAATIEEAGLVASSLIAPTGAGFLDAVKTLRAIAEGATSRRRTPGRSVNASPVPKRPHDRIRRPLRADASEDTLARVGAERGAGGIDEHPSLPELTLRSWDRPTQRDWIEVIGALPLFSGVPKRHVRAIAKLAWRVDHAPGEVIVQAGDRGNSMFLMLEGRARVLGKSRMLRAGDFFGEMALIDGGPRTATIIAASQVRVMMVQRRAFLKVLKQNPPIALAIMETLAQRVRRLERAVSA